MAIAERHANQCQLPNTKWLVPQLVFQFDPDPAKAVPTIRVGATGQNRLVKTSIERGLPPRLRHAPDTGESTGKESIMGKGPIALPHRPDEDSQHQPESNEEEQQKFFKTTAET